MFIRRCPNSEPSLEDEYENREESRLRILDYKLIYVASDEAQEPQIIIMSVTGDRSLRAEGMLVWECNCVNV
jgi:hypothetical protein